MISPLISRGYARLVGSSRAALADGQDRLKASHRIVGEVDVQLAALSGGNAEVITVANANLNALAGVDVVVAHHVAVSGCRRGFPATPIK